MTHSRIAPGGEFATITTETRHQRLTRLGQATPRFLQGAFSFAGRGFFEVGPLHDDLRYVVPAGATAEVIYLRAGNMSDDLLYLALCVNGLPVRYFPAGPKADFHVPLSITETYPAGARIEVGIAAPRGLTGSVVVDVGILEEGKIVDGGVSEGGVSESGSPEGGAA